MVAPVSADRTLQMVAGNTPTKTSIPASKVTVPTVTDAFRPSIGDTAGRRLDIDGQLTAARVSV
jgi:hypothetical protein